MVGFILNTEMANGITRIVDTQTARVLQDIIINGEIPLSQVLSANSNLLTIALGGTYIADPTIAVRFALWIATQVAPHSIDPDESIRLLNEATAVAASNEWQDLRVAVEAEMIESSIQFIVS